MNETERDREVDAAWRATSRETPPPALDAAIRAAARREVGARPGGAHGARRWWPLAAAAAVALVAVGIVQMTPPEQVAPTADRTVTDMPTAKREAKQDAAKPASPKPPSAFPVPVVKGAAEAPDDGATVEREAATGPKKRAAVAPAAEQQRKTAPREDAASDKREIAAAPAEPQGQSAAASKESAPSPASPPVAAMRRNESFVPSPPAMDATTPSPPNAPAPSSTLAESRKPSAPAAAGAITAPATSNAQEAPAAESEAPRQKALAKLATRDEGRAKDAPRPPAEWIALIRKLKSEGKTVEAAKELTAFRAAYKERADALLPDDLREPKAQEPAPASR